MKQPNEAAMNKIYEKKKTAMLRLQAVALMHEEIADFLREEAEKHEAEAKRLINNSRSLEVYKNDFQA